jgi:hypothetical protein
MSIRERIFHFGKNPAFGGESAILKTMRVARDRLIHPKERRSSIPIRRQEGNPLPKTSPIH